MRSELKALKERSTLLFQTSKIRKEFFINVGYNLSEKHLDFPPEVNTMQPNNETSV